MAIVAKVLTVVFVASLGGAIAAWVYNSLYMVFRVLRAYGWL